MVLARVSGVGSPASALARNDPTLLTKPDPSNPPSAGMISPSLPSAFGLKRGASGGSLYPSRNGSFLPSAEDLANYLARRGICEVNRRQLNPPAPPASQIIS